MKNSKTEYTVNSNLKKRKQNIFTFLGIIFFTIIVMITSGLFPMPRSGYTNLWSMANWGLSYNSGFILRGLTGTLITAIKGAITFKDVYVLSLFLFLVLMAGFIFVNIKMYKKSQNLIAFILIAFLMAQPSNARWLMTYAMFARLDNIIIIIALLSFYVLYKYDGILMYILLLSFSVLAILIHEVFAVAFSSLIFALILLKKSRQEEKLIIKPLMIYYLPILVVFIAVILFGGTNLSDNDFIQKMQQNFFDIFLKERLVSVSNEVILSDFSDKREVVAQYFTKDKRNLMILTYIVLSPTLLLFAGMFKALFKSAKKKYEKIAFILIIGSCFAPLTSSFLGTDHYRWIGYFIFCLSIAIVFIYFYNKDYRKILLEYVRQNGHFFIIAIIIAITFGTLSDLKTMALLEGIYHNRLLKLSEFIN